MKATVLGLGEAGARYAADLTAAGWQVLAFDPADVPTPAGVTRASTMPSSVAQADLVLSLTGAAASVAVAREAAAGLRPTTCFADLNTATPGRKRDIQAVIESSGARMADVAVLGAVPRRGIATPLVLSGPGAAVAAQALSGAGAPVELLEGPVGAAAGRKLLRSVFMKGLAALVLESLAAGRAAGCETWLREQIVSELGPDGELLVERLIQGSHLHAGRRLHEVEAARDALIEFGVPAHMCEATMAWLTALQDGSKEVA